MRVVIGVFLGGLLAAPLSAGERAVRGFCVQGETVWAVGDDGLILRSDDRGSTWESLAASRPDPNGEPPPRAALAGVNLQAATADGRAVYLLGGRGLPGHPRGAGAGVIIHSEDGGKTLAGLPAGPAGWLYGGAFSAEAGAVFGEAGPIAPGGVLRTISGGKMWKPVDVASGGYLLGGDFRTFQYGYLVGRRLRIVSLRNLTEPRIHPQELNARLDLRSARFTGEEECWAAGQNGVVLRSRPTGRPWTPMPVPLPRGTARCADFEAIASASPKEVWVAGGLLGSVLHTADGGGTWDLLPAPEGGMVHAMRFLPGGTSGGGDVLLAGGDGGRIWRSGDGGKSWKLLRGAAGTDILFVLSPADGSAYPAIAAHSLAGCNVAVLFAGVPSDAAGAPPDQPLRAAAIRAGAGAVTALSDFPSQAAPGAAETLTEKDVLAAWSAELDSPAEEEMLRQSAAAIRLYRPTVLAVGPDANGPTGPQAECRLVSRLAQKAAEIAASDDALKELAQVGLKPWKVQRVFVGLETNRQWRMPWETPERLDRKGATTLFDTAAFPAGQATSLEMIALEAVWELPWFGLGDRPGRYSAYRCKTETAFRPLFTSGLSGARLDAEPGQDERWNLSAAAELRAAVASGRIATVLPRLCEAAGKAKDDPLPADRILLVWTRLLEEGRLAQANEARDAFLKLGGRHPMFERINVLTMAEAASAEWRAQLAAQAAGEKGLDLSLAAKRFAGWTAWNSTPDGAMLHAKILAAAGRTADAAEVLRKLSAEPYDRTWRDRAEMELALLEPARAPKALPEIVAAGAVSEPGKIDGLLGEPCWQTAPRAPLVARDGNTPAEMRGASFQAIRTVGNVVLAVRLPVEDRSRLSAFAPQRTWRLEIAIDSDRDAWTQLLLSCDTQGRRSAQLLQRYGPAASVRAQNFPMQAQKAESEYTFELAIPISELGGNPQAAGLWHFQIRAEAREGERATTLHFVPQGDDRLLPERYGALQFANWAGQ